MNHICMLYSCMLHCYYSYITLLSVYCLTLFNNESCQLWSRLSKLPPKCNESDELALYTKCMTHNTNVHKPNNSDEGLKFALVGLIFLFLMFLANILNASFQFNRKMNSYNKEVHWDSSFCLLVLLHHKNFIQKTNTSSNKWIIKSVNSNTVITRFLCKSSKD